MLSFDFCFCNRCFLEQCSSAFSPIPGECWSRASLSPAFPLLNISLQTCSSKPCMGHSISTDIFFLRFWRFSLTTGWDILNSLASSWAGFFVNISMDFFDILNALLAVLEVWAVPVARVREFLDMPWCCLYRLGWLNSGDRFRVNGFWEICWTYYDAGGAYLEIPMPIELFRFPPTVPIEVLHLRYMLLRCWRWAFAVWGLWFTPMLVVFIDSILYCAVLFLIEGLLTPMPNGICHST